MKTTVELPDPLVAEAKAYASQHGLTFRQVLETGLRHVLENQKARAKPFRLRKHTFKGQGLVQDLGWDEIREMIYKGRGGA